MVIYACTIALHMIVLMMVFPTITATRVSLLAANTITVVKAALLLHAMAQELTFGTYIHTIMVMVFTHLPVVSLMQGRSECGTVYW